MGTSMEDNFYWVLLILLTFLVQLFVLKVVVHLWWRPKKIEEHFSKQGIRGPPYRLFIGNLKEIVGMMLKASSQPMTFSHNILPRVLSFYHHWKKIYGATFLIWFGPTARLAVSDPVHIREIFLSKAEFYEKYEAHPLVRKLEGEGLITLKGQKWAYHRKIITPTFHMENLNLMIPVMGKSVAELLEKWSAMSVSSSGSVEIEISECFQALTEEVITRTVFGSSYEHGKAIFRLQAQQMVFAIEAFQKVFIPGYRFFPTKRNRASWKLDREIRKSLMELIDRRKKNERSEIYGGGSKDLLEIMIKASGDGRNESNCGSTAPASITVSDIVEECKGFFFAGKYTTSNLLTWTAILLAMHPEWQESARDEVLRVCGARDVPTKDDVAKLRTLGMILNESLRLYPPAVATIRRTKFDVQLGGCKIPRGTELLIPVLAVHHDQALWGQDATEFNPARFANGAGRAAKHPMAFIPFGLGARKCMGQNLAILQTKVVIAMILRQFSFNLAQSYQHAPTVLMLLHPQYGAPIIFHRLSEPTGDQDQRS